MCVPPRSDGSIDPVVLTAAQLSGVRQVFKVSKAGQIAGSYIREGEARRKARVRVKRNEQVIHEGAVSSLKHFQENVREVRTGFECGIGVEGFSDFEEGDIIEFTIKERVS